MIVDTVVLCYAYTDNDRETFMPTYPWETHCKPTSFTCSSRGNRIGRALPFLVSLSCFSKLQTYIILLLHKHLDPLLISVRTSVICSFWVFSGIHHKVCSWILPFFHVLWLLILTLTQYDFNISLPISRTALLVVENV